jgi:hypothetical protein
MDKLSTEEGLLENAIKSLSEIFDIKARTSKSFGFDAKDEIELEFNLNGKKIRKSFDLEIQKLPSSVAINQIVLNKYESNRKQLLVSYYVPPIIAEKLRELDISFIDTKGNAFFKDEEFYIFISSQAKVSEIKPPRPNLIFQQSGLKLLFVLLSIPNSENYSYRKLAELCDISLGSVNEIIANLQQEFYLVNQKEKRILVRKDKLLKRWVQGYAETLRPKLKKIYFQTNDTDWQTKIDLNTLNYLWGAEPAASNLTNFLKPSKFTIYTDKFGETARHIIKQGLRPASNGEIEVLETFWNFEADKINVPPLLVYADLVASADSRNLEVAKIIYDQYLARLVE